MVMNDVSLVLLGHIIWGGIGVMFLAHILLLLRKNEQSGVFISHSTSVMEEIEKNALSLLVFSVAFALAISIEFVSSLLSVYRVLFYIPVLLMMVLYFILPKKIELGDKGVLYDGSLVPWKAIKKVTEGRNGLILRRDRVFLLPALKLPFQASSDIHEQIRSRLCSSRKKETSESPSVGGENARK